MGNSYAKLSEKPTKLVAVTTTTLRERLNKLYDHRQHESHAGADGLFEYLWDLKEKALMEGRSEVEVPSTWLDDLEESGGKEPVRTH